MGLFDQFPYTNFHELNLDWILKALKELEHTIDQFVAINALKYADPIQWDITTQYEKNTIVIDPQTGTAYISVQPVPIGVSLANPDYWTVVFDLGSFVVRAAKNLANTYEAETTLTATVNTAAGGWLVWGDTLYKANVNITAGDSYVEGGNITHFTIEDAAGHLDDLTTTDKSNLVAAINEVLTTLVTIAGDLNDLDTTDKSNLVAAINEVLTTLVTIAGDLNDLDTTDKSNLVAAINEVISNAGDLNDLNTSDKSNLVAAINEVNTTGGGALALIGDLDDLDTTDKSNLVAAINEVNNKPDPIPTFLTVADMIAADLAENAVVNTLGYYAYNDGGGASYVIKTSSSTVHETLNNGLVAELVFTDTINVLQVGAKGDGVTDDLAAFNTAINNASTIEVPRGNDKVYILSGSITIGMRQNLVCKTAENTAPYPKLQFTSGGLIINGRNVLVDGVSVQTLITENAITIGTSGGSSLPYIKISNCYIYNGKWGIKTDVNAWMLELENIRMVSCASGLYLDGCGPCVSLKNVYFDRCANILLYSNDSRFSAIGCNFGFNNGSDVRLTLTQAEFIDCNFECEETITNRMFNIAGRQLRFDCCKFALNGTSGCYLFGSGSSLWSLIFENCIVGFQGASAGSGFKPPITVRDDFGAYSYGAIVIGKGCQNISMPSPLYDAQYPYFINHSENGVMNFKGTSVLTDHLHAGNVLFSTTLNKMCYFDGTNVRRMDTDAVVV